MIIDTTQTSPQIVIDVGLNEVRFRAVYLGPPKLSKIPWVMSIGWGCPQENHIYLKVTCQELVSFIDSMDSSSKIVVLRGVGLKMQCSVIELGKNCLHHTYSQWLECTYEEYHGKGFPVPKRLCPKLRGTDADQYICRS